MKKIGIITTFKANNYGAELQAFALQNKLKRLGYDSYLIDYLFYKNREYKSCKRSRPLREFSLLQTMKNIFLYKILLPILDVYGSYFNKNMKMRKEKFLSFHKKNSNLTRTYYSFNELYQAKFDFDVYCVGSDQVWNPNTATSIEPYFLTFAPKNARKIAYASSFGVSDIEEEKLKKKYTQLLNNIDILSSRELQGVQLIKRLTGREAENVLDPTLLLQKEEWEEYISYDNNPHKERYIVLYNIHESASILKLAYKIHKETGYPILKICKRAILLPHHKNVINIKTAGPAEFLGLMHNAAYVITNSFHGTVFSIIFQRKFFSIMPNNANNNSRVENFLGMIGLKDRLFFDNDDIDKIQYNDEVDYKLAKSNIDFQRGLSIKYLVNAIENS